MTDHQSNTRTAPLPSTSDEAGRLGDLLTRTSRTFALSIPLLERPLRDEVTIAYLLFRIADTIEDEVDWPAADKARALRGFAAMLAEDRADATDLSASIAEAISNARVDHSGYAALMSDAASVLDAYAALDAAPRAAIARHLARTAEGMADQVTASSPPGDLEAARAYCYAVAGIVGELCTDLFIGRNPTLTPIADRMMNLAPVFGEGLQLVNILRDERDDDDAGRRYIPSPGCRDELARLAENDLSAAAAYVGALESYGASPGTVAFNALNACLAFETLALVNTLGPGVKIGKERVSELVDEITDLAAQGGAIMPVLNCSAARLR